MRSAIWKAPVPDRRWVSRLNVAGDARADLVGHGGEHRAVFVYQVGSYRYLEQQLGRSLPEFGQFGENFTVDGLSDEEVCISDRYAIGSALFEVTQPVNNPQQEPEGARPQERRTTGVELVADGDSGAARPVMAIGQVQPRAARHPRPGGHHAAEARAPAGAL